MKKEKGFSLFETLIYITIVSAVLLAALSILTLITRINSGQIARTEVDKNLDFVSQRFTYWGLRAKAVYPAGATSTNEVRFIADDTFARFWLDTASSTLKFQEATSTPEDLSTLRVRVSPGEVGGKLFEIKGDTVQMNIKIQNASGTNPYAMYERVTQGSVTVRSQGALWPDGLVGYWGMDEKQATSTKVFDGSGNANEGTIRGSALRFDGSDDYTSKVSFSSLPVSAITVEAWFKLDTHKNWNNIVSHEWPLLGGWILFADSAGNIFFGVYDGAQKLATGPILATDTWYHAVGTFNTANDQIQIYVNGATGTPNSSALASLDSIGNVDVGGESPGARFDGVIDEVRIYNRALSTTEITEHYYNQFLNNSGLVLYVPFDNRSGATASDHSGIVNNFTLTGFTSTAAGTGDTSSSGWTTYGRPNRANIGTFGNATKFNGKDDDIKIPDSSSLRLGTNQTVEAWIYPQANATNWVRIVGKGDSPNRNYGLWREIDGDILCQWFGVVSNSCWTNTGPGSPGNVPTGGWHHTACTYDSTQTRLYVDGNLITTCAYANTPYTSADPATIGYAGFHTFFDGLIDEARIYKRALSPNEISLQYNAFK